MNKLKWSDESSWGGQVMKGGLVSIDDIFILQMSTRILSSLPWGGRKVGEKKRGRNF